MTDADAWAALMAHAKEDLGAHVRGGFSDDDWTQIFSRAHAKWQVARQMEVDDLRAWQTVVLDFYRNDNWGFRPPIAAVRATKTNRNYGLRFIWLGFTAMTLTNIALAWTGQLYAQSDEPKHAYMFFAALTFALLNFAYFLYQTRHHRD